MAVSAGRLVTILEAQTSQFDARMTAASKVVERFTRPQILATRALGQMQLQMRMLTSQALGMTGPIGNLASSLLGLFGGPTALLIGAGIGGLILLVKKMGDELAAAAKRTGDLTTAWLKLLQAKGPNVPLVGALVGTSEQTGALEQRTAVQDRIAQLEQQIAQSQRLVGMRGTGVTQASMDALNTQLLESKTQLGRLNDTIALLEKSLADARTAIAEAWTRPEAVRSLANLGLLFQGRNIGGVPSRLGVTQLPGPGLRGPARGRMPGEVFEFPGGLEDTFTMVATQIQGIAEQERQRIAVLSVLADREAVARLQAMGLGGAVTILAEQMNEAAEKVKQKALMMQIAIVNSIAGAVSAIMSGGGVGGILGLAGGVLGFVNPLAGAIVAGVGSVISAAESRRQRHTEQQTAQIVSAIEEDEQQAIVVVRSGFEGDVAFEDQLIATLARLSDRRIAIHPLGA